MNNPIEKPKWMSDESVKNIPSEKLDFLENVFVSLQGKNQKETMSTLLPLLKKAKKEQLNLTGEEMQIAIAAIKKYSTKQELEKINHILNEQSKANNQSN